MPIIDTTINQYIDAELIRANAEREEAHEPSGRLSASMLYQPTRFQVLKTLGAPRKPFDAYTLAKFKRGQDVEDWFVTQLKGAGVLVDDKTLLKEKYHLEWDEKSKQPRAMYREVIGFVDSVIDTDQMQAHKGIIPNEIKSVTNAKMKNINRTGIDWHYQIQACLYALAMGVNFYAVTIVSAEDLRAQTHIFHIDEMKQAVDHAIGEYMVAMERWKRDRSLPRFAPNEHVKWTGNLKYAMFEEFWAEAPDSAVIKKLETLGLV